MRWFTSATGRLSILAMFSRGSSALDCKSLNSSSIKTSHEVARNVTREGAVRRAVFQAKPNEGKTERADPNRNNQFNRRKPRKWRVRREHRPTSGCTIPYSCQHWDDSPIEVAETIRQLMPQMGMGTHERQF